MKIFFISAIICFFNLLTLQRGLYAWDVEFSSALVSNDWPSPNNWELDLGYRSDKLEWSTGIKDLVNITKEVQWQKLRIAQIGGVINYVSPRNYAIKIAADYGHIYDGESKEADFAENDKTDLVSLTKTKAGRGFVYDLSGAVGYRLTSTGGRCTFTPLIGGSVHEQDLRMFNGRQVCQADVLGVFIDKVRPIHGLNNSYKAFWYGPWIGLDFNVKVEYCAYIFGGFEWHLASYRGNGHWNLSVDSPKFSQKAYGHGYIAILGGNWEIWKNISIGIVGHYRRFQTHHGRQSRRVFTDTCAIYISTRFNQVKWASYDVSATLGWRF